MNDGELCQICGRRYRTVYWIPDKVWKIIRPNRDDPDGQLHGGLLCPTCADDRARSNGIELYWEPSVGDWRANLQQDGEDPRTVYDDIVAILRDDADRLHRFGFGAKASGLKRAVFLVEERRDKHLGELNDQPAHRGTE